MNACHAEDAHSGLELMCLIKQLDAAQAWGAEAMNVLASPTLHALRRAIIEQAAARRLPAIYQWGESAREGGLLPYGPFRIDVVQGIARQLARVLNRANPAELPVEQPTRFELVILISKPPRIGPHGDTRAARPTR